MVLINDEIRAKAVRWVQGVPQGTRIEFKAPKRTLKQNAKMWVMLTEVSEQVAYHGIKLDPDDWKLLFLDALKREVRMVPNLDGNGFTNLGRSSSDLSQNEMADLIEIIYEWGNRNGVHFADTSGNALGTMPTKDRKKS